MSTSGISPHFFKPFSEDFPTHQEETFEEMRDAVLAEQKKNQEEEAAIAAANARQEQIQNEESANAQRNDPSDAPLIDD